MYKKTNGVQKVDYDVGAGDQEFKPIVLDTVNVMGCQFLFLVLVFADLLCQKPICL